MKPHSIKKLYYCGVRVQVTTHDFGTSGRRFVYDRIREDGQPIKRGARQWKYWFDPSVAAAGHNGVMEDTMEPGEPLRVFEFGQWSEFPAPGSERRQANHAD